jgi:hypothetical protein
VNKYQEALHRLLARHQRRALPIRTSREISTDPEITLGVATIKIVTEEQIQAIAFGPIDAPPNVIVRLDPIGRDVTDIMPFARFLESETQRVRRADARMRIWIPHSIALEGLDILGHRYWRNQSAPPEVVRMGEICRIIAHEAQIPGQQLVADTARLLQSQLITGMAPIEEAHLHALLAWLDPSVVDPLTESRRRIRVPASGVLPNTPDMPIDDRVDRLRKDAKGASGVRRVALEAEIAGHLRDAVLREWNLMVEGRRAFLRLALPESSLTDLIADSSARVARSLDGGFFPARAPHMLAASLGEVEAAMEKVELASLEGDLMVRDQAARAGAVVRGVVSAVHQARPGFKPCDIELDSDQAVMRFRNDDKVRILGTNVTGVVRQLTATPSGTRLAIEITAGVRTRAVLTRGARLELIKEPYAYVNHRALAEARVQEPWMFYGDSAPVLPAGRSPGASALTIARSMRRV